MNVIDKINKEQCTHTHPEFNVGDTLKVYVRIVEGGNERVQAFTGVCIARNSGSIQESFTLRRVQAGQGVERVFPINSPRLAKIEVMRRGEVRRAKLYYLRDKIGKAAKIKDKKD